MVAVGESQNFGGRGSRISGCKAEENKVKKTHPKNQKYIV